MLTILAIGAAAIAAVTGYNRARANNPDATASKVTTIRQSVSVVSAVTDAVWAVLDALIFLTRARGGGNTSGSALRPAAATFGRTVAADVGEG